MAIGRTVEEGLLKAIRSLEIEQEYLDPLDWSDDRIMEELTNATDQRIFAIAEALRRGMSVEVIADITRGGHRRHHEVGHLLHSQDTQHHRDGEGAEELRSR